MKAATLSAGNRGAFRLWVLVVLLAIPFAVTSARATVIVNGGFDTPVPSNGTGGGWTSLNIGEQGGWSPTGGNPGAGFVLHSTDTGGLEATLQQLVPGWETGQYMVLEGYYAFPGTSQTTGSLMVDLDDTTLLALAAPASGWEYFYYWLPPAEDNDWLFSFRATSGSAFAVDNIALRSLYIDPVDPPTPVPEPATALLLGPGIAALVCAKRNRNPRRAARQGNWKNT